MSPLYAGLVYEMGLYCMLKVSDISRFLVAPVRHRDFRESSDWLGVTLVGTLWSLL